VYETLKVKIEGIVPTLMHNGQLANPLNKWAKALKAITGKRKKSDSDYEEMARLEFLGSLYVNEKNEPCWPGECVESMLVAAAKKQKEGPLAKTGMMVDGLFPLNYRGPKDGDALWKDESFRLSVRARVGQASIMRMRPIFREWSLDVAISYLPDIVNRDTVMQWCDIAGRLIGLSDWRPKYGRFEIAD
jgi:hypothetical protein